MKREKVVCPCRHVTVEDVMRAVAGGARNFTEVQNETGIARSCYRCREYAEHVFAAVLAEYEENDKENKEKEPRLF